MFYRPADGHGLPHNPFNAIVAPRPVGWISTRGSMGDNLAPYSFFNATAYVPPQVMFSSTGVKESLAAVRDRASSAALAVVGYRRSLEGTTSRYQAGLASLNELEEARRWVLAADEEGACYGLRLPGDEIAPDSGEAEAVAPVLAVPDLRVLVTMEAP